MLETGGVFHKEEGSYGSHREKRSQQGRILSLYDYSEPQLPRGGK